MSVATDTDLEVIEALDFKEALPCEGAGHAEGLYGHEGDGWALVEYTNPCSPSCGQRAVFCKRYWDWLGEQVDKRCVYCSAVKHRDEVLKVVEVL